MNEHLTIISLVVIACVAMFVLDSSQEIISAIAGGLTGYLAKGNGEGLI